MDRIIFLLSCLLPLDFIALYDQIPNPIHFMQLPRASGQATERRVGLDQTARAAGLLDVAGPPKLDGSLLLTKTVVQNKGQRQYRQYGLKQQADQRTAAFE